MKNDGKAALANLTASAEREFGAFLARQTPEAYEDAVALIEECRAAGRRVHVTGIGKPGHLAGYGASLLSSTGTPSYFLHGTEAVHGSCGQLEEGDALLLAHVDEEGGPLNRAPRNSVLAEMFVLQALSAILQADVAQTPAQYVRRHPGGALGKIRDNER